MTFARGRLLCGGRPRAKIYGSVVIGEPAAGSWSRVWAGVFLCVLVLGMTGCGTAERMPLLLRYRPPLRVPPSALAIDPGASRVAKHALRVIARTMQAPRFPDEKSVSFGDVAYQLIITNAGSAEAFTADQTVTDELTVMPDSSARMREEVLRPPRLISRIDQRHWQAAGRRPFTSPSDRAGTAFRRKLPAGAWSFTPQGRLMTFQRVRELPTARSTMTKELGRLLGAAGRAAPPASLSLRQYGFILATAPLTRGARKALLEALGALRGIHMCDALFPGGSPEGDALCVNGNPTSTEILLDPDTGVVTVVCERLDKPTLFYPNMRVGSLVDSNSFSLQPSPS